MNPSLVSYAIARYWDLKVNYYTQSSNPALKMWIEYIGTLSDEKLLDTLKGGSEIIKSAGGVGLFLFDLKRRRGQEGVDIVIDKVNKGRATELHVLDDVLSQSVALRNFNKLPSEDIWNYFLMEVYRRGGKNALTGRIKAKEDAKNKDEWLRRIKDLSDEELQREINQIDTHYLTNNNITGISLENAINIVTSEITSRQERKEEEWRKYLQHISDKRILAELDRINARYLIKRGLEHIGQEEAETILLAVINDRGGPVAINKRLLIHGIRTKNNLFLFLFMFMAVVSIICGIAASAILSITGIILSLAAAFGIATFGANYGARVFRISYGRQITLLSGLIVLMISSLLFWVSWSDAEWQRAQEAFEGFQIPRSSDSGIQYSSHRIDDRSSNIRIAVFDEVSGSSLSEVWRDLPRDRRANIPAEVEFIAILEKDFKRVDETFLVGNMELPGMEQTCHITILDKSGSLIDEDVVSGGKPLIMSGGELIKEDGKGQFAAISHTRIRNGTVAGNEPNSKAIVERIEDLVLKNAD
ncbi:MAG: hypothetical protein WC911_05895 [Thermoleophilia bacterium]